jgi:hypothetical protein
MEAAANLSLSACAVTDYHPMSPVLLRASGPTGQERAMTCRRREGPSGEPQSVGGRALLGSAVRPYPSPISGHGPYGRASRGGRARVRAPGESPTLYRSRKA